MKTIVLVSCVSRKREERRSRAEELSQHADLAQDRFILLAGSKYAKPLRGRLEKLEEPLQGLRQGYRVARLKELINAV